MSSKPIPFDQYMARCLYDPASGYYMTQTPLGREGDFTTAPELSPLLAQAIAHSCVPWAHECAPFTVVEMGPGRGRLASQLLQAAPFIERYVLVDVSPSLRREQENHLNQLPEALRRKCVFAQEIPQAPFEGLLLGNEVLDALPVKQFIWQPDALLQEVGVVWLEREQPKPCALPASPALRDAVHELRSRLGEPAWSSPYRSEWLPGLPEFTTPLYRSLKRGGVVWLDYGYPERTYYHPERNEGTFKCFSKHQAHDDPYQRPGQQDLTAHVNFSQVVVDAEQQGLEAAGYSSQSGFLLSNNVLSGMNSPEARIQAHALMMPDAMGETIKALCLSRGIDWEPIMSAFDKIDTL